MFSEKAPYIVTIVVAGLAWTLTHIVDRLLATPMLSYQVQQLEKNGKKSLYVILKNVTRDKTFRSLRVVLTAAPDGALTEAAVIPVQPASEGDQPFELVGRTFDFTFMEIQPGWQFEISAGFQGQSVPALRMSLANETLYAVTPSFETILVEHETTILFALVGLWILILFALFLASKSQCRAHVAATATAAAHATAGPANTPSAPSPAPVAPNP